jgi:hypothetical protein
MFTTTQMHDYRLSLGVRAYFHQVTKIEDFLVFPVSLSVPILGHENNALFAVVSTGGGPVLPNYSGGLRFQNQITTDATSGLEVMYYYGASWAGTDAGAKVSQLKLQLDVRGL